MNSTSTAPATTPARRTRTGCKTCRSRKLKCDETKPVCGQCRKSNRECVASEGIAFRHAQNAGLNEGGDQLSSFYKYRQKFNNTYFLPVPRELCFVQVTDPYASTEEPQLQPQLQPQQPVLHQYHNQYEMPQQHNPGYVDVAASSLKAMIDPSLEDGTSTELPKLEGDNLSHESPIPVIDAAEDNINETIMKALRNTDEHVKAL